MPHRIAHAKAYPFAIPAHDYEVRDGHVRELGPGAGHRADRTAVIATGSNRSHEQILRKFGDDPDGVPVEHAWLEEFDVVYAAHITSYGSIPATLQHVSDMRVRVSVNWLNDRQLGDMHATEGNYDYVALERIGLTTDQGPGLDRAHVYIARNGHLVDRAAPVALSAAEAENRPHAAIDQDAAQQLVHARLKHGGALDDFILENVEDADLRKARSRRLGAGGKGGFAWPYWRMP